LFALPLDPGEALNDRKAHLVVVELLRRGHSHPAHRWVDANVQMLE
jgi:hypothetical protein